MKDNRAEAAPEVKKNGEENSKRKAEREKGRREKEGREENRKRKTKKEKGRQEKEGREEDTKWKTERGKDRWDKADREEERLRGKKRNGKQSDSATRGVLYIFAVLFLLMAGYLAYFVIFESEDILNNSYNRRLNYYSEKVVRGDIVSEDGTVLATTTVDEDGNETRTYPYGELFAHIVGYNTNGRGGVELVANYTLLTSGESLLTQLKLEFAGEKENGDTVITTLDVNLQQAVYDALDCEEGAAVILDPSTGKILAMVSKPDFDPENLSELLEAAEENGSEESFLVNRATQGLYAPGSTFKILTLLEYYRENQELDSFSYECDGSVEVGGYELHCAGNKAHGTLDLKTAFAKSCNGAFATIGLSLNIEQFGRLADALLFNQDLALEISTKQSSFTLSSEDSDFTVAQTVIGQGETLVTPIHLAMIMSAIANDGVLMTPYVIAGTESVDGNSKTEVSPTKYGTLISSSEAEVLREYLSEVTENGTAASLASDAYEIYGKTGTAQTGTDGVVNSWFVGCATAGEKEYVICVLAANRSESAKSATAMTKEILKEIFE